MTLWGRIHGAVAFAAGRSAVPEHPHRLVVEISNACNLRCTFCPRTARMTRSVEFMEPEVLGEALRGAAGQVENVSLNGYGEPTMHPRVGEFVRVAHSAGVGVSLSTNCTLLDERRARAILDAQVDLVTLAIDGVEAKSYEAVRVGADFARVIENARRFLRMRRESKARTFAIVQCIAMAENRADLSRVRRLWRDAGADAIRIRQLTHTGNTCGDERFVNRGGPCYWLWAEPMILADGRVVACCQDVDGDLEIGDLARDSLSEAWRSEAARRLRVLHAEGRRDEIPTCRRCNMVQPPWAVAVVAALADTNVVHRIVPRAETLISRIRYRP